MKLSFRTIIHDSFEVGIFIKAFDGVMQIFGSILLLLIKPETINSWIGFLTEHELSTDPHDWLANHLVSFAQAYTSHTQWFAAIYLFSHGIVKLFLIYNLWQKKLWAYPLAIWVFVLFGIYQMYRYAFTHSIGLLILTVLDVLIIILTWFEWQNLKETVTK